LVNRNPPCTLSPPIAASSTSCGAIAGRASAAARSSITRFENVMFSYRDPGPQRGSIGQPNVSGMTQFETVTFSASPPPKRKTGYRVLNVQLVTVC